MAEWDSKAVATQKYKVLRAAATGGLTARVKLDDQLSLAQRTFDLRGLFTGVNAVSGEFFVGSEEDAGCPKMVAASASSGPSALGAGAKIGAPLMQPVALDTAARNEAPLAAAKSVKKVAPKRS